ncbi:unnamed protein product [Orchesella dallaii]|uniref:Thioredoxin domain-containing protein 3 n=1 Tax=Orchesella dallaii TaxID=48710 RepID=A0ABP1QBF5_9HEXA
MHGSFMAQKPRIRLRTVTETKMFSKKMHRLVKKIQDKPVDSLDLLSDMARKGGSNLSIPIEVDNEQQWTNLLKREGLIVVDVFSGWSGPCTSMFSILRKLKLDTNDDRLVMAAANADNIAQLAPFRNQSEPCWLFIGGGKPVNVLRGSNAPKLVRTIKSELQHELDCIEGKAKRNLISLKFEAGRREKAVNEAITLDELMTLEEEEKKAKEQEQAKSPTPPPNEDENESYSEMPEKEKSPDPSTQEEHQENEEDEENNEEKEATPEPVIDEALLERRKQMEESNKRLKHTLRPYTVIAIQSYLLETGAVTEIKDHLAEDFNLVRERYINLNDDGARKLFGIPTEVPDPNPPQIKEETLETEETGDETIEGDEHADISGAASATCHANVDEAEMKIEDKNHDVREDGTTEAEQDDETGESSTKVKREKIIIPMIPVPIPELIVGDTLILLLECTKVKPTELKNDEENRESGEADNEVSEIVDEDADYFIVQRTGSTDYEAAIETQPESLMALYGKEKYVAGVWCPRSYEQKRFVMLNYFPQFVTEMLMPPIPEPPKYHIFVFSALFSSEILEHPEYIRGKKDIVAEKRIRISFAIVEKMLLSSKREGDYLKALKWALGTEVLVVSANGKNGDLIQILNCFDPIFDTNDILEAGYFTAKLFPDLEVLIDENPFPEEEEEDTICNMANIVGKFTEASSDENAEPDLATVQDENIDQEIARKENSDTAIVHAENTDAVISHDENPDSVNVHSENTDAAIVDAENTDAAIVDAENTDAVITHDENPDSVNVHAENTEAVIILHDENLDSVNVHAENPDAAIVHAENTDTVITQDENTNAARTHGVNVDKVIIQDENRDITSGTLDEAENIAAGKESDDHADATAAYNHYDQMRNENNDEIGNKDALATRKEVEESLLGEVGEVKDS